MANENDPLFYLPSLGQYQRAQRDAQSSEVTGLLNKRLLASSYDFARSLGYKTPEERQIESANKVMADAEMSETETDPIERQYNVLAKAAKSFNQMGLTDYVQRIAPEMARLRNQKLEQIKLMADAENTIARTQETDIDTKYKVATLEPRAAEAFANAEAAGLGEETWINQNTGDIKSVNSKSRSEVALAKSKGYTKYVPGIGADKDSLTKKTAGDLQTSIIDTDQQLQALQEIAHTYKPEYLNYEGKVKNWGANVFEQFGGEISAQQAAELTGYTDFRRNAANAFNRYIKYITGAQMSQAEADRIQKGFLNAEKDGPTAFKAKLRSTTKEIIAARKRAESYLRNGGVIPTNADGSLNGDIWDKIQLPQVSDEEVNAFLGPLAGGVPKKKSHAYSDPAKEAAYQEWLRTQP